MSKTNYYRQCRLTKPTENGVLQTVSWIPEKYAVVGRSLRLKNRSDEWEDGWNVAEAGETRLDERHLPDYHSEIKNHRKRTGDSMKKETNRTT